MLPITNHRAFHIPHSIATAAAILGLVAALGWDVSGPEVDEMNAAGDTLERVGSIAAQDADTPEEAPAPRRAGGAETDPGTFSGLLPLVLPSISGF